MKKTMRAIVCLTLVLVLGLSMAACGKKEAAAPSGKYLLVSMKNGDEEVSLDAMYEQLGEGAEMFMDFNDDGTGVLNVMGQETPFTWEGNTYTVQGQSAEFQFDGKTVKMVNGPAEMVFEQK